MPKTIDCTPTRRGILPALLALYENGDAVFAQDELRRMAKAADAHNTLATKWNSMLAVIDGQLAGVGAGEDSMYVLQDFTPEQLKLVRTFIESFDGVE